MLKTDARCVFVYSCERGEISVDIRKIKLLRKILLHLKHWNRRVYYEYVSYQPYFFVWKSLKQDEDGRWNLSNTYPALKIKFCSLNLWYLHIRYQKIIWPNLKQRRLNKTERIKLARIIIQHKSQSALFRYQADQLYFL